MRPALVPIILADPLPWAKRAEYAWDFLRDRARFAGGYKGALANTPNWTFTRASTGYAQTSAGALTAFASGELRRTDKGVLIEGARTNLFLRSQDWSASWNLTNVTVTSAATTAPDGTLTASKIEATTSAATTINQNAAVAATSFSASIYIKKGSGATDANAFKVRNNTTATDLISITVNYDTGAITYVTGSSGATMTALADGWWRLTFVYSGITSGDGVRFFPAFIGGTETANEFCYLWGAQLEAASFPSSYIPTTTASATRAADFLTVPVTQASPLAAFAEFEYATGNSSDALNSRYALQLGTSSANRAIFYNLGDNGANGMLVQVSDEEQAGPTVASSSIASGVVQKVAGSVDTNNFRYAANGVSGTPDVSGTGLSDVTAIKFATDTTNQALYGYLRRAALWTRALTDAELQSLTT